MQGHDNHDKPRIILPPGVTWPPPTPDEAESPADEPTTATDTATGDSPAADLHQQLEEARAQVQELEKDQLLLRAEFENFRKRLTRTSDDKVKFASQSLILELLQVADNLDRAIQAGEETNDIHALLAGLKMVGAGLYKALNDHGVTPIPAAGETFDPNIHEVVSVVDTDQEPNQAVLQIAQTGYFLHDRVIRPAKVVVARHPTPSPPATPDTGADANATDTATG